MYCNQYNWNPGSACPYTQFISFVPQAGDGTVLTQAMGPAVQQ
jgi:hypothetical protein